MHKINENVFIKDLKTLQKIYEDFYFKIQQAYVKEIN